MKQKLRTIEGKKKDPEKKRSPLQRFFDRIIGFFVKIFEFIMELIAR